MRDCLLRWLLSLPLLRLNVAWYRNSRVLMSAIPKREHERIAAE